MALNFRRESRNLSYYVRRIQEGAFSLVRYGDGEWKAMVPGIPLTPLQKLVFSDEEACAVVRKTVVNCYRDARYLMATCRQKSIKLLGHSPTLRKWVKENVPKWIRWHDGHVFRCAAMGGLLFPLVAAIKAQPLPVVMVGPAHLVNLRLANYHIVTPPEESWPEAWYRREEIKAEVRALKGPALFSFSVGTVAKVLIHDLFPELGEESYLIDFGAVWEGLCGYRVRHYHSAMTAAIRQRNLYGHRIPTP